MASLREQVLYAVKTAVTARLAARLHDMAIADLMSTLDDRAKTAVTDEEKQGQKKDKKKASRGGE